ncbi:hypothetical protein OSH08_08705 [Kaistia geumhonensis]|uniref:NAD(P)/FAD-binding protein YdhS n=1 Tax=Kaistia geumhonensis TaxID=410839 RepID=A0ABU0M413_9HYPH|nr:hypothetical protein [Kaistia geumhonensis]MCX5479083.1 hypothetical protein [Kaistia geumhonensis]MDQ0515697.1 putative NAD(P)/FAD-binding protein YdhS [Kaistia geumhonensis]
MMPAVARGSAGRRVGHGRVPATPSWGRFERIALHAVLIATGPAHGRILASHPLLSSLGDLGLICADPVSFGIDTALDGSFLAASGERVPDILIAGPLARGTFGKLMGLPEAATYAGFIAERVAQWISRPVEQSEIAGSLPGSRRIRASSIDPATRPTG